MFLSTVARRAVRCRKNPGRPVHAVAAAMVMTVAVSLEAQEGLDPTAIEHALVEYLCRTVQRPAMIGTEEYQRCYASQLSTLREPFGRDLSSLTAADRKTLDSTCGQMQATRGRDAYLACLYGQLMTLKERRSRGKPPVTAEVPAVPPAPVEDAATAVAPVPVPEPSSSTLWWVVGAIAAAAGAGGVAFVAMRSKRPQQVCRGCGAAVEGSGDLCANCRHEAADARRRAIAERVEEERALQEKVRRDAQVQEEERYRELQRREEELRLRAEEERRTQEERERRLRAAQRDEVAAAGAFDPHEVLGVAPDATRDAIRAAYQQARAKYDPREYEHLGVELQEHFRAKAAAVERAYQMLAVDPASH